MGNNQAAQAQAPPVQLALKLLLPKDDQDIRRSLNYNATGGSPDKVPVGLSVLTVTENFYFLSDEIGRDQIPRFLNMNCTVLAMTVASGKVMGDRVAMETAMAAAIQGKNQDETPPVRKRLLKNAFIKYWTKAGFTKLRDEPAADTDGKEREDDDSPHTYTVPDDADVELFIYYRDAGAWYDYHANFKWYGKWYGKWGGTQYISMVKPGSVGRDVVVEDERSGRPEQRVSYRHVAWLKRPADATVGIISAAAGFDEEARGRAIGGVAYDEDESDAEEMFAAATSLDYDHPSMCRNRELLRERRRLRQKVRRVRDLVLLAQRVAQS